MQIKKLNLSLIKTVKKSEENKIDDNFAKNLGAKDLNDLKILVSKQINDEYKNSLDQLAKNQILKELEKFKVEEIPENLIEEEIIVPVRLLENEIKKNKKDIFESKKKN